MKLAMWNEAQIRILGVIEPRLKLPKFFSRQVSSSGRCGATYNTAKEGRAIPALIKVWVSDSYRGIIKISPKVCVCTTNNPTDATVV